MSPRFSNSISSSSCCSEISSFVCCYSKFYSKIFDYYKSLIKIYLFFSETAESFFISFCYGQFDCKIYLMFFSNSMSLEIDSVTRKFSKLLILISGWRLFNKVKFSLFWLFKSSLFFSSSYSTFSISFSFAFEFCGL